MSIPQNPRIVALDANALVCLCAPDTDLSRLKLMHLVESVDKLRGKILLPTPAVAEFLVLADQAALAVLDGLKRKASVLPAPFDLAAAFELSQMDAACIGRGDKRDGSPREWQKIKIDRQLVAIAKRFGAQLIVSEDGDVRAAALRAGIAMSSVGDLPIPDEARQVQMLTDSGQPVSTEVEVVRQASTADEPLYPPEAPQTDGEGFAA